MLVLMRGALVAIVLVAACGGSGVDLEVTYDEAFDHVEVFIGNADCYTTDRETQDKKPCPGVAWMNGQARPPGDVYVMSGDDKLISIDAVKNGTATMHLEATEGYRQPIVIAVVAFEGDTAVAFGTIWGARIPASSAEHWKIELETASPASAELKMAPPGSGPDKRVWAWSRERVDNPAAYSRCLAMQLWDDGEKVWKSKFIVPESDPDCDGQTIECDPLYTDFNPGMSANPCIKQVGDPTTTPCAIGQDRCADGVSADHTCTLDAPLLCVPQQLCSDCSDTASLTSCAADAVINDQELTKYHCQFVPDADAASEPCVNRPIGANTTRFTVPVTCANIEVRKFGMPLSTSGTSSQADVNQTKIQVSTMTGSSLGTCTIVLSWESGAAQVGDKEAFWFVMSSNGNNNKIAFPVFIDFAQPTHCGSSPLEPAECASPTAASTDTIFSCL